MSRSRRNSAGSLATWGVESVCLVRCEGGATCQELFHGGSPGRVSIEASHQLIRLHLARVLTTRSGCCWAECAVCRLPVAPSANEQQTRPSAAELNDRGQVRQVFATSVQAGSIACGRSCIHCRRLRAPCRAGGAAVLPLQSAFNVARLPTGRERQVQERHSAT